MRSCNHCGNSIDETRVCPLCEGKKYNSSAEKEQDPAAEYNPYAPPKHGPAQPLPVRKLNPWQYYVSALKKYAVFHGRASRSEYWWFMFFDTIVMSIITTIIDTTFNLYIGESGLVFTLYHLATLIPYMSVTVRRLHDCDKRCWFMLIPVYGWPILPIMAGTYGPNRFGPDPTYIHPDQEAAQGDAQA